ncbi:MAG: oxidoreductase, partial [Bacteroidaceae bacterium]|nr:oxidoreductase [Bacteroidaceae bacterium]
SDCAASCLAAIMGRESAYKGRTITWDEISKSDLNYMPENLEMGPVDMTAPNYQIETPGK